MHKKKFSVGETPFLYIAMNAGSPTGWFRDSAGYQMLQQRTYVNQLVAAKELDRKIAEGEIDAVKDSSEPEKIPENLPEKHPDISPQAPAEKKTVEAEAEAQVQDSAKPSPATPAEKAPEVRDVCQGVTYEEQKSLANRDRESIKTFAPQGQKATNRSSERKPPILPPPPPIPRSGRKSKRWAMPRIDLPVGYTIDSDGYRKLQAESYEAQRAAAAEMDKILADRKARD